MKGRDRQLTATLMLAAAICLGQALQCGNGTRWNGAIPWLTASLVASLAAVLAPYSEKLEKWAARYFYLIAGAGLVWQFFSLLSVSPGAELQVNLFRALQVFIAFILICFAVVLPAVSGNPPLGRATILIVLLSFASAGVWLIQASPRPRIDTFFLHQRAAAVLMGGSNPYAMESPNIYDSRDSALLYGSSGMMTADGHAVKGYPYPPLSLLLTTASARLTGEARYANLLGMVVAAGVMALARPRRQALLASTIFLLTPRGFFVLERSWTDPMLAATLAGAVYASCRAPRILPYAYGLFLAMKQYAVLTLPLAWFIMRTRAVIVAIILAIMIGLPFLIWSPKEFLDSLILMQARQPFRDDSLSYLAWLKDLSGIALPGIIGFIAAAIAGWIAWLRLPRTAAGFSAAVALETLVFFAFNKQAFCNYYYFVIAAMCCCCAATQSTGEA